MFPWRITTVSCIHWSHLIVLLSTFQICRTSVSLWNLFLYFWWNSREFFPMNTDASNVEEINSLHIKECLLLSCVASFEDWSWIFRTRSFTLCKKDLDTNDMSDSATVSESISSSRVVVHKQVSLFLHPSIHQTSTSWEDQFLSAFHSE